MTDNRLGGSRDGWGLFLLGVGFLFLIVIGIQVKYDPVTFAATVLRPVLVPAACDPTCTRDYWDLAAQQSMAIAAWGMVAVSFAGMAIGGWSLLLIWRNLLVARAMASDASISAKAARDAVEQARETVSTTREIGIAQVRAYLAVNKVSATVLVDGRVRVEVAYFNSGQTPAKPISMSLQASLEVRSGVDIQLLIEHHGVAFSDPLAAGGRDSNSGEFRLADDAFLREIWNDHARSLYMVVHGTLDYTDVFGVRRSDEFDYEGVVARTGGSFSSDLRRQPLSKTQSIAPN